MAVVRQYQTRPQTVDAWQRTSGMDSVPIWVPQYVDVRQAHQGWKVTLKGMVTCRKEKTLYRNSDEGHDIEVDIGDWLVIDQDGAYLYNDREFKKRFELIAQGPGHQ